MSRSVVERWNVDMNWQAPPPAGVALGDKVTVNAPTWLASA